MFREQGDLVDSMAICMFPTVNPALAVFYTKLSPRILFREYNRVLPFSRP
jgi:hypothetical protein